MRKLSFMLGNCENENECKITIFERNSMRCENGRYKMVKLYKSQEKYLREALNDRDNNYMRSMARNLYNYLQVEIEIQKDLKSSSIVLTIMVLIMYIMLKSSLNQGVPDIDLEKITKAYWSIRILMGMAIVFLTSSIVALERAKNKCKKIKLYF